MVTWWLGPWVLGDLVTPWPVLGVLGDLVTGC